MNELDLKKIADWNEEEILIVSDLAFSLVEQGFYEEALRIFEGLIIVCPQNVYFNLAIGSIWLRLHQPTKAIAFLNQYLQHNEIDPIARLNRGESFLMVGQVENALRDLNFVAFQYVLTDNSEILRQSITRAKALIAATRNLI